MGVDAHNLVLFQRNNFQLYLAEVYLWERINVSSRVQFLLHGGEDEAGENIPFCVPVGSPGATEPTPWLPGGIPFPGGFLLLWSLL